jgi:hypothetical protein
LARTGAEHYGAITFQFDESIAVRAGEFRFETTVTALHLVEDAFRVVHALMYHRLLNRQGYPLNWYDVFTIIVIVLWLGSVCEPRQPEQQYDERRSGHHASGWNAYPGTMPGGSTAGCGSLIVLMRFS